MGTERVQAVAKRTHKDGSLIEVELLAAPVILHGEPVGTYAIYKDISELQRRRQYLEAASPSRMASAFILSIHTRSTHLRCRPPGVRSWSR